MSATTIAQLLGARAGDDRAAILDDTGRWTWSEAVREGAARGVLARDLCRPGPDHVGVLLPNVPEYLLWLIGTALAGVTVVGLNPTRRGAALAADVRATDCRLIVTDREGEGMLAGLDTGVGPDRVLVVGTPAHDALVAAGAPGGPAADDAEALVAGASGMAPDTLLLLLFTSGTTGVPKAVRCTQGRLAAIAGVAGPAYGYTRDDVCYCPMPLFHGNALMALWGPALWAGASVALRARFSASAFVDDVRRYRATTFSYVGKAIAYVLATPERPDDAATTLSRGFGTEASARDRESFEQRFGCRLVEGYGQSEGGAAINAVPGMPHGALGLPAPGTDLAVVDPGGGTERERARFDAGGRLCNAGEAIGEIVNRSGPGRFEGYYGAPDAERDRMRGGWYRTGDLGYRDEAGYFYFAGRHGDWLRVDSENLTAAPIEAVLSRHPDVVAVAVYAVPDPGGGDQVMAALELAPGCTFDAAGFARWLDGQPDLGTKWAPRFVRLAAALPQTATGKVAKVELRRTGWECDDPVWWWPPRGDRYRVLTADDRRSLAAELAAHGRAAPAEQSAGVPPGAPTPAGRA